VPVVRALAQSGARVSIDTSKLEVAEAAVRAGARYVNDVTAFRAEPDLAGLVADAGGRLLPDAHARRAAHDAGRPALRRRGRRRARVPRGADGVRDREGVKEERIELDPGIGFGKTVEHNLELLRRLDELTTLGRPSWWGPRARASSGG
jgi:dihydropteroate synthase